MKKTKFENLEGADEKSKRRYGTKKLRDRFPDTKMHLV